MVALAACGGALTDTGDTEPNPEPNPEFTLDGSWAADFDSVTIEILVDGIGGTAKRSIDGGSTITTAIRAGSTNDSIYIAFDENGLWRGEAVHADTLRGHLDWIEWNNEWFHNGDAEFVRK